jgi:hypothetical protein
MFVLAALKGVNLMLEQWETYECWVAQFDILGFKSLLDQGWMEFKTVLSQSKIDEVIESINDMPALHREHIDYLFYADTFIFIPSRIRLKTILQCCLLHRSLSVNVSPLNFLSGAQSLLAN